MLVPDWAKESARIGLILSLASLRATMGLLTPEEAEKIIEQAESDIEEAFE